MDRYLLLDAQSIAKVIAQQVKGKPVISTQIMTDAGECTPLFHSNGVFVKSLRTTVALI